MGTTLNKPITVLIVEDEPVTQEILANYLAREGFAALVASTGEEALSILRRAGAAVDWLFTDINLPGCVDGWIVGSEFHLSYPLRPVVYTSSFAATSTARAAASVFVTKPYSPAEVVAIFKQLAHTAAATEQSTAELMGRKAPALEANPARVLEKRSLPRRRALLRGRIEFNNRYSTMDCVIRDITEKGARLVITGDDALPSVFELALPLKSRNHRAEIVWRKGRECGVRFVA